MLQRHACVLYVVLRFLEAKSVQEFAPTRTVEGRIVHGVRSQSAGPMLAMLTSKGQ